MKPAGALHTQEGVHARAWHAARDSCLYSGAVQRLDELCAVLEYVATTLGEPATVVEIGSGVGGALAAWQRMFPAAARFGVDLTGVGGMGAGATVLAGDSHDPATLLRLRDQLAGRLADVLFIDGDKTAGGAGLDWEMYGPLVRPGGLTIFGGIADPAEPAMADWWARLKAAPERRAGSFYEIVSQGGTPIGFGIIQVGGL